MSRTVVPYLLHAFGYTNLPRGARPLRAAFIDGQLWLWALVDPAQPFASRKIHVCSDGEFMPGDPGAYVGSARSDLGAYLHVFDQGEA